MTPRAAIQQLGRIIRDDLRSGGLSAGAHDVGDMLVEQPDAVLLIIDVTAAEARKRGPDELLCQAYAFMLGQTLERLRRHRPCPDHDRQADFLGQAPACGGDGARRCFHAERHRSRR